MPTPKATRQDEPSMETAESAKSPPESPSSETADESASPPPPQPQKIRGFPLKNISTAQWLTVLGVSLAVVSFHMWKDAGLGYLAVNDEQYYYKIFTARLAHPEVFSLDPVYGDPANFQAYVSTLQAMMRPAFERMDFLSVLRLFQPVLGLLYLLSAFTAFYKICGRPWISLLVAILSGQLFPVFPNEQWGALSLGQVTPKAFFLVFAPWLFYGWLRHQGDVKKLVGVFMAMGAVSNLHPVSGLTLIAPMLMAQLIRGQFKPEILKITLYCGLAALAPMLPLVWKQLGDAQTTYHPSQSEFQIMMDGLTRRMPVSHPITLFQTYLSALLAPVGWLGFGAWAAFKTRNGERLENSDLLTAFCLSCLVLFSTYYLVNFTLLVPLRTLPELLDLTHGLKFVMLPVFLWILLWLSGFEGKELAARAFALGLIVTLVNGWTLFSDVSRKPFAAGRHLEHQYKRFLTVYGLKPNATQRKKRDWLGSLEETGEWLERNTPKRTTLVHASLREDQNVMIRAIGERSVTFAGKDGGLLYRANKPLFLGWNEQWRLLESLHKKHGLCSEEEVSLARRMKATHFICDRTAPGAVPSAIKEPVAYQNHHVTVYSLRRRMVHVPTENESTRF